MLVKTSCGVQAVASLTQESEVPGSIRAVISSWQKCVHEVRANRLGGLSMPRKSVIRLIDRPNMTIDIYRGCKTFICISLNQDHSTCVS